MDERSLSDGTTETGAFAALLRRYRVAAGLSQEALAEKARMSAVGIGALERGTRKAPYRETVALLADALGLAGADRTAFAQAAKRKRAPAKTAGKPSAQTRRRSLLPARLTSFVGREAETAEIVSMFASARLVCVAGFGGVGKTSIALRAAADLSDAWNGEVWFVPLAGLSEGANVPGAIAAALGLRLSPQDDPVFALAQCLRERRVLIVLDNCEHVVADAAAVAAALLRACDGVAILATSREPLSVSGERVFRLRPLAVPPVDENVPAEQMQAVPAVALFVDRARAADASFRFDAHNAAAIARICRELDGIPLAIELAAARVRALGPAELVERLDDRLRLLTGGGRDAPAQQQTLRATMEWSYALLDEAERAMLRRCAIFAGGFDLAAAGAVTAPGESETSALDRLSSLVDKSLVSADLSVQPTRYSLLESTRAFALEMLTAAGEREDAAQRHLRHYRATFERADRALEATLSEDAIVALVPDLENLRAALAWSLAGGDVEDGLALVIASGRLWFVLGLLHERIAQLETFATACGENRPASLARIMASLTYIAGDSLRASRALEFADRAVAAARRSGDATTLHQALVARAFVAARRRDLAAARAAFDEADAIEGVVHTARERVRNLSMRGLVVAQSGDLDAAAADHDLALTLTQELGNAHWRMVAMLNLAEIEHQRGRTERAIELAREASPEAARRLAPNAYVHLMNNLAAYQAAVDDVAGARASAEEALTRLAHADPKSGLVAIALEHLALVIALEGDVERAARLHGYCEASYAAGGYVREFTERASNERLAALIERSLDPARASALSAAGAAMPVRRAVEEATAGSTERNPARG